METTMETTTLAAPLNQVPGRALNLGVTHALGTQAPQRHVCTPFLPSVQAVKAQTGWDSRLRTQGTRPRTPGGAGRVDTRTFVDVYMGRDEAGCRITSWQQPQGNSRVHFQEWPPIIHVLVHSCLHSFIHSLIHFSLCLELSPPGRSHSLTLFWIFAQVFPDRDAFAVAAPPACGL